jgi:ribosomal protein S18 acetylase RimI-like enzyme
MKNYQIRNANKSDFKNIYELHMSCFNSHTHYLLKFGDAYIRYIIKWILSYEGVLILVAENNLKIIGYTVIATKKYLFPMIKSNPVLFIKAILKNPNIIFNIDYLERMFKENKYKNCAYNMWTAVNLEFRNIGVGTSLKRQAIKILKQSGYKTIITRVGKNNISSIKTNIKNGYFIDEDISTNKYFGMVKIIND